MQPPDGPPVCTALIVPPSGAPPPISSTISRSVVPIGTSTSPVLRILPARAKTLVPLLFSVPIAANQSRAVADDRPGVGERLDVVDQRRIAPEARLRRVGGPRAGRAPPALDRGDQRGLLAADEGAGADAQVDAKVERRVEDLAAQQPQLPGLPDGGFEPLDGQRVFAADVNVALVGADGIGGDGHALEHAVRVALEHAAVHERAGVALVGVADDELAGPVASWRPLPISARWDSPRRRGRAGRCG